MQRSFDALVRSQQAVDSDAKVEIDIDADILPQTPVSTTVDATSSCAASGKENEPKKKNEEEVIDLTQSDSEEEPLMPRKKHVTDPFQFIKYAGTYQTNPRNPKQSLIKKPACAINLGEKRPKV